MPGCRATFPPTATPCSPNGSWDSRSSGVRAGRHDVASLPALPREIEAHPDHATIRARLPAPDRLLWRGGQAMVPVFPLGPPLARIIHARQREKATAPHQVTDRNLKGVRAPKANGTPGLGRCGPVNERAVLLSRVWINPPPSAEARLWLEV